MFNSFVASFAGRGDARVGSTDGNAVQLREPQRVDASDYALRATRLLAKAALERLSGDFDRLYAAGRRDSIAPEKLLRAPLQTIYSVWSE